MTQLVRRSSGVVYDTADVVGSSVRGGLNFIGNAILISAIVGAIAGSFVGCQIGGAIANGETTRVARDRDNLSAQLGQTLVQRDNASRQLTDASSQLKAVTAERDDLKGQVNLVVAQRKEAQQRTAIAETGYVPMRNNRDFFFWVALIELVSLLTVGTVFLIAYRKWRARIKKGIKIYS